jgi:hypothetical protein
MSSMLSIIRNVKGTGGKSYAGVDLANETGQRQGCIAAFGCSNGHGQLQLWLFV